MVVFRAIPAKKKKKGKQWAQFRGAVELVEGRNICLLGCGWPCNRVDCRGRKPKNPPTCEGCCL